MRIHGTCRLTAYRSIQGDAARRWLVGAAHAAVESVHLFSERFRQARRIGLGPIERNAEGSAAGAAVEARIVLVGMKFAHRMCCLSNGKKTRFQSGAPIGFPEAFC